MYLLTPKELKKEEAEQSAENKIKHAHQFLINYLDKFNEAKRGGIHDFIELTISNMIQEAIQKIDDYLKTGHKQVLPNEIMAIVADSFQKVIDGVKRNLDKAKTIGFNR